MSVESMATALKIQGLPAVEKLILLGIANHDGDGGAWPSMSTLSEYAGLSVRQTQRNVQKLVDRGLLEVHQNEGGNRKTKPDRRPNLYILHINGVTSQVERGDTQTSPRGVTPDVTRTIPGNTQELDPPTPQGVLTEDPYFAAFFEAYPKQRRLERDVARRSWNFLKRKGELDTNAVMIGLRAWCEYWEVEGTEDQYIPYPSPFLRKAKFTQTPPQRRSLDMAAVIPIDVLAWLAGRDREWATDFGFAVHKAWTMATKQGYEPGELAVRLAILWRTSRSALLEDPFCLMKVAFVSRFKGEVPSYFGGPTSYVELMDMAATNGKWQVRS